MRLGVKPHHAFILRPLKHAHRALDAQHQPIGVDTAATAADKSASM